MVQVNHLSFVHVGTYLNMLIHGTVSFGGGAQGDEIENPQILS